MFKNGLQELSGAPADTQDHCCWGAKGILAKGTQAPQGSLLEIAHFTAAHMSLAKPVPWLGPTQSARMGRHAPPRVWKESWRDVVRSPRDFHRDP